MVIGHGDDHWQKWLSKEIRQFHGGQIHKELLEMGQTHFCPLWTSMPMSGIQKDQDGQYDRMGWGLNSSDFLFIRFQNLPQSNLDCNNSKSRPFSLQRPKFLASSPNSATAIIFVKIPCHLLPSLPSPLVKWSLHAQAPTSLPHSISILSTICLIPLGTQTYIPLELYFSQRSRPAAPECIALGSEAWG